jgi:sigma-E factor negative regulatory protein RseA
MNEELDSQLSAMFDNELPAAECELLARRLSRDDELKERWSRYAAISATIRAEGGVRLDSNVAVRVSQAISVEPTVVSRAEPVAQPGRGKLAQRWAMPVGGVALAASVAAAAILFVRYESPMQPVAQIMPVATPNQTLVAKSVAPAAPDSYTVPKTLPRRSMVPSTQLANYVVAHSEFSSPVNRRNLLSAFMASESGTTGASSGSDEPTEEVTDDAKSPH